MQNGEVFGCSLSELARPTASVLDVGRSDCLGRRNDGDRCWPCNGRRNRFTATSQGSKSASEIQKIQLFLNERQKPMNCDDA